MMGRLLALFTSLLVFWLPATAQAGSAPGFTVARTANGLRGHQLPGNQGRSLVVGGIRPCLGPVPLRPHGLPRYSAGTVTVLRRQARWGKWNHGVRYLILPTEVVARATVGVNAMYRFALFPGHYVLVGHFPHSNIRPYTQIVVRAGATVHADIPDMCR